MYRIASIAAAIMAAILVFSSSTAHAQDVTYVSVEQRRFAHTADGLQYSSTSWFKAELTFHFVERYIILKNLDTNHESRYINVELVKKESWRAYSKETGLTYLFSIVKNKDGTYIVLDDGTFAIFIKVSRTIMHSKLSK